MAGQQGQPNMALACPTAVWVASGHREARPLISPDVLKKILKVLSSLSKMRFNLDFSYHKYYQTLNMARGCRTVDD